MKNFLSANYSATAFNLGTLLLRIGMAGLILPHGYGKFTHFSQMQDKFMSFLGLGTNVSLALVIFAELICAFLLIIGLFTRLAAIPPIIAMLVAVFIAHKGEIFGDGEHAALYVIGFVVILLLGPGRFSVDGMRK